MHNEEDLIDEQKQQYIYYYLKVKIFNFSFTKISG